MANSHSNTPSFRPSELFTKQRVTRQEGTQCSYCIKSRRIHTSQLKLKRTSARSLQTTHSKIYLRKFGPVAHTPSFSLFSLLLVYSFRCCTEDMIYHLDVMPTCTEVKTAEPPRNFLGSSASRKQWLNSTLSVNVHGCPNQNIEQRRVSRDPLQRSKRQRPKRTRCRSERRHEFANELPWRCASNGKLLSKMS